MRSIIMFLVSVVMVVSTINIYAQVADTKANLKISSVNPEVKPDQNLADQTADLQNQNLKSNTEKGQIYIGNDWSMGKIVLRDGVVIDSYHLRYNILDDQLEFIEGIDTNAFANPKELSIVTFGGHTFVYENYQADTAVCEGYFEIIVPGKNKLMLRRLVTKQKPDTKYPNEKSLIKYQVDECYFISKPGMPANKLACNRKSALTFLNDHDKDIAEYLRITGNKVRTIEDLKNLVSYYNSLDDEY
jgi:hypothetical protein